MLKQHVANISTPSPNKLSKNIMLPSNVLKNITFWYEEKLFYVNMNKMSKCENVQASNFLSFAQNIIYVYTIFRNTN